MSSEYGEYNREGDRRPVRRLLQLSKEEAVTAGGKKQRDLEGVLEMDISALASGLALGVGRRGKNGRSQGCIPVCGLSSPKVCGVCEMESEGSGMGESYQVQF